jgi:hypothetical protein
MAFEVSKSKFKQENEEIPKQKSYVLKPNDSHKSFYGKAHVIQRGDKKILRSYDTDVAEIEDGKAKVKGLYSQTTTRHIKAFLIENGFKAESSKQIMADYGVKE